SYDEIGKGYAGNRKSDPHIAAQIFSQLQGARRILNIGAGTGSYEPPGMDLVAVEPSAEMIAQRKPDAYPVIQASAEQLPFAAKEFSHALTILSMHHWTDLAQAFREINRVTTDQFVAVTWNPAAGPFWLTRDYIPQVMDMDRRIFPAMADFEAHFDDVQFTPLLIPEDCQDGFLAAYWKRPRAYLDAEVRKSISAFPKIGDYSAAIRQLEDDLNSGAWAKKNASILEDTTLDAGYVIVTGTIR
ncbi:MAG: class I SAM-dependent methyltransferase, partial [Bacteroidota bacterium]